MRPEKKKDAALNDGEKRKWVGIDRRRNEEVKAIKKVMKEVINRERKPQPHVWWWKGETLIDSTDKPGGFANVMNNQLVVSELSRYDLHSVYTCQAFNTNITQPVQTSVTVEMYPLTRVMPRRKHLQVRPDDPLKFSQPPYFSENSL
ncbi:hypothetical protein RUM44_001215 [Polyplax serrata]|uniref:Immunoglobulin-like beta-sandwich domain-containing protein n=1 Tax=Polyplax serrata TaxID=468196 RepID=A0ABR1B6U7_POLSC